MSNEDWNIACKRLKKISLGMEETKDEIWKLEEFIKEEKPKQEELRKQVDALERAVVQFIKENCSIEQIEELNRRRRERGYEPLPL